MQIKTGLEESYKKSITFTDDGDMPASYFQGIVDAVERVGCMLDEGKTPEQALEGLNGHDLTGFMAGVAVDTCCYFNPRGDELRPVWNKQWGGTGEEKAVLNPAIVTIG